MGNGGGSTWGMTSGNSPGWAENKGKRDLGEGGEGSGAGGSLELRFPGLRRSRASMGGEQSRLVEIQVNNNSGNTTMYNPSFQISPGQSSGSALAPLPLTRSEFLQLLTSSKIADLKGLLDDEDEFLSPEMLQKILKCRRMDLTVVKKSS